MAAVQIVIVGRIAGVFSPYDPVRVEIIRGIPGRRWIPDDKVWEIPSTMAHVLRTRLEAFGDTCVVTDETRYPWEEASPPPPQRAKPKTWADELLSRCEPELREKVFRVLTGKLHPDVGGNTELQRELNDARDRIGKASA